MGLLDFVTGGKSSDATAVLERAYNDIKNVKEPTAEQMKYVLTPLVQQGVITPEMAKTFLQDPSAFKNMVISQIGTGAQENAINTMQADAARGGLSPADEQALSQVLNKLRSTEKGANDAVVQRQAERGALTGGETMAAQLMNNQTAAMDANQTGMDTAASAYENRLKELALSGEMGATLQGQQNTQANTVAAATDAINKFNATQQQETGNLNTGVLNAAQASNLGEKQRVSDVNVGQKNIKAEHDAALQQQVYDNALRKAAAEAGVSEAQAANDTTQGGQLAGMIGTAIGAGGQAAAGARTPTPAKGYEGGEIHDYLNGGQVIADNPHEKAVVPGNSPENDKIPALLSEHEIVLPRSVAHGSPQQVMEFLNRVRGKPLSAPHPEDVSSVLRAMGHLRENPHAA